MGQMPSMDEILKEGQVRQRRSEIALGLLLVAGGLAWRFGMHALLGDGYHVYGYGAVGVGVALLCHGAFGGSRG